MRPREAERERAANGHWEQVDAEDRGGHVEREDGPRAVFETRRAAMVLVAVDGHSLGEVDARARGRQREEQHADQHEACTARAVQNAVAQWEVERDEAFGAQSGYEPRAERLAALQQEPVEFALRRACHFPRHPHPSARQHVQSVLCTQYTATACESAHTRGALDSLGDAAHRQSPRRERRAA